MWAISWYRKGIKRQFFNFQTHKQFSCIKKKSKILMNFLLTSCESTSIGLPDTLSQLPWVQWPNCHFDTRHPCSSIASPTCISQEGQSERTFLIFCLFFPIFPLFFLIFPLFFPFFFAVRGGTLPPMPPSGYTTASMLLLVGMSMHSKLWGMFNYMYV